MTLLAVTACSKSDLPKGTPACIENMVNNGNTTQGGQGIMAVYKWEYPTGEVYYYFQMDCCDQFNELYDEDCNYICAPDGGFTGSGDGQCDSVLPSGNPERTKIWDNE